jgi:hypothetical protein
VNVLELVSQTVSERVYEMEIEDFPPAAVAWVKSGRIKWAGPEQVALADIDFSQRAGWKASNHPGKLQRFRKMISAGKRKPVILIRVPGKRLLMVIDGHHRALASYQLRTYCLAYVGTVDRASGPWDRMHAMQRSSRP